MGPGPGEGLFFLRGMLKLSWGSGRCSCCEEKLVSKRSNPIGVPYIQNKIEPLGLGLTEGPLSGAP